jgi:catechol-2,3-dioxygenase
MSEQKKKAKRRKTSVGEVHVSKKNADENEVFYVRCDGGC